MEHLVFPDCMCLGKGLYVELFLLVLLICCKDDKEKVPFGPKPLLLKQLLYAFLRKNKAFRKYRELTDTSPLVHT